MARLVKLGGRRPTSRVAIAMHLTQALGIPMPPDAADLAFRGLAKKHYLWVARVVHPDKCQLARAAEAFRVVDDAYKAFFAGRPI